MLVEHGPRIGTPAQTTYYGDWHTGSDGHQHRRILSLIVDIVDIRHLHPTHIALLPRKVPQWSIVVTQHSTGNPRDPKVLVDQTVADVHAALKLLREAMEQAIRDGYAEKVDLERVPAPLH
jgi:hypothetical protein